MVRSVIYRIDTQVFEATTYEHRAQRISEHRKFAL